jgi:hypothetical protein
MAACIVVYIFPLQIQRNQVSDLNLGPRRVSRRVRDHNYFTFHHLLVSSSIRRLCSRSHPVFFTDPSIAGCVKQMGTPKDIFSARIWDHGHSDMMDTVRQVTTRNVYNAQPYQCHNLEAGLPPSIRPVIPSPGPVGIPSPRAPFFLLSTSTTCRLAPRAN